jgi:hypothetical protein
MTRTVRSFLDLAGAVTIKTALESVGIVDKKEEEITIYAKIGNMDGLHQASSMEQHEQAEIKSDIGRIRIRKTTRNGRVPVYDLTTKKPIASGATVNNRERTKSISEDIYNVFMDVCPTFMAKTRYTFKSEQLRIKRGDMESTIKTSEFNFEVDVFTKADGTISNWCKIDIEVDKIAEIMKENGISVKQIKLIAVISKLPFEPNNIVIDDGKNDDPDKQELLKELFTSEFLIKRAS